eukprot:1803001-Prymnesium_polylepis.1
MRLVRHDVGFGGVTGRGPAPASEMARSRQVPHVGCVLRYRAASVHAGDRWAHASAAVRTCTRDRAP